MANGNDTFTETIDTTLVSHTSDSGHTWSKHQGNSLTISAAGDYVYNAAPSNTSKYNLSVTPSSAEYDVQASILGTTDNGPGVLGRIDVGAGNEYGAHFNVGQWVLYKLVAGIPTTLGTYVGDVPTTAKTVKLEIRNATKKVFIDGVERISSADNEITATGLSGFRFMGVTGEQLDTFSSTDSSVNISVALTGLSVAMQLGTLVPDSVISGSIPDQDGAIPRFYYRSFPIESFREIDYTASMYTNDITAYLIGSTLTASQGSLGRGTSKALAGNNLTLLMGNVNRSGDVTVALAGLTLTSSIGNLGVSGRIWLSASRATTSWTEQ